MSRFALAPLWVLVASSGIAACGLQKGGTLEEVPDTSIVDSGKPETVVPDVREDVTPSCDPKSCPSDQYCTANGCDYLPSCEAILAKDPTATSRPYAIRTKVMKAPETAVVYCVMDVPEAPGGWMLFARTDATATAPFGWTTAQPDLNAANAKYTFDLQKVPGLAHGMIAVRSGKLDIDPAGPILTFDFPSPFPGALGGSTTNTSNLKVVRKTTACPAANPPTALKVMGLTDATDRFFFGEQANELGVGILPNGFKANVTGCGTDFNLTGSQILLFVQLTP